MIPLLFAFLTGLLIGGAVIALSAALMMIDKEDDNG